MNIFSKNILFNILWPTGVPETLKIWDVKYVPLSRDCTVATVRHDRRSMTETGERKPGSQSLPAAKDGPSVKLPMKTWYV